MRNISHLWIIRSWFGRHWRSHPFLVFFFLLTWIFIIFTAILCAVRVAGAGPSTKKKYLLQFIDIHHIDHWYMIWTLIVGTHTHAHKHMQWTMREPTRRSLIAVISCTIAGVVTAIFFFVCVRRWSDRAFRLIDKTHVITVIKSNHHRDEYVAVVKWNYGIALNVRRCRRTVSHCTNRLVASERGPWIPSSAHKNEL